ncbi:MAG: hypothetical protein RLZ47_826 [Bacteroidota bacterium]|jgi:hypothetical protein
MAIGIIITLILYKIDSNTNYNRYEILNNQNGVTVIDKKTGINYLNIQGVWYTLPDRDTLSNDPSQARFDKIYPKYFKASKNPFIN